MRPLDPLFVILGCYAVFALRGRAVEPAAEATQWETGAAVQPVKA
jgi:hypothetical protein